jgi:arylsulfatase A-like enzyme
MHVIDWFPTIASLVGYKPEIDLKWDGIDQWPALTSAVSSTSPRTIYIAMKGGHALRHGDWKLIVLDQAPPQLFNIATDPYEKDDVAASHPQQVAGLQKLLVQHQAQDNMELPEDLVGLPK